MIVVSVIGIFLVFGVLLFSTYRKISRFLAFVLAASILALTGGLDVAAEMVGAEGSCPIGTKGFVGNWLIIFVIGALPAALCGDPVSQSGHPPAGHGRGICLCHQGRSGSPHAV